MKIITERDLILAVVDRWAKQYPPDKYPDSDCVYENKQSTLAKLKTLDLATVTNECVTLRARCVAVMESLDLRPKGERK